MAKHKMDQIIVVLPGILGSVLDLRRRPFVVLDGPQQTAPNLLGF